MPLKFEKHFTPNEMPAIWGSPAKPDFPNKIRLIYGIGFVVALVTASLQNNLIIAYIPYLQGDYGFTPTQGACVTAAYYMGNVWTTIMLFRLRQHFGLKIFFICIFVGLLLSQFLELMYSNFSVVIFARFIGGVVGEGINVLTIYYALEMLPPKQRYLLFPISIGLIQIGSVLSRFIVAYFSISDYPHLMLCFEAGICIIAFCVSLLIELPPSQIDKAFLLEDSSIVFYALATAICCFIFSVGNIVWWHHSYIAYGLCIAIVSFGIFFLIEFFKKRPFINLKFLTNIQLIEVALAAAFVRMCLAEQSTGATGLFKNVLGFSDYQLMDYYGILTLGALCGGIACIVIYHYERSHGMILFAAFLIPLGSFLSTKLSIDMLPSNLYLGQFLIAFASVFFIGPLMVNGIILGYARRINHLVTFAAIFTFSQGVFGLLGSAIIGFFIQTQTMQHIQNLLNHSFQANNLIQRFKGDFYEELNKQAGILAYGDLFFYIGVIGACIFLVLASRYVYFKLLSSNSIQRELNILKTKSINSNLKTAQFLEKLNNKETKSIRRIQ